MYVATQFITWEYELLFQSFSRDRQTIVFPIDVNWVEMLIYMTSIRFGWMNQENYRKTYCQHHLIVEGTAHFQFASGVIFKTRVWGNSGVQDCNPDIFFCFSGACLEIDGSRLRMRMLSRIKK